MAVIRAAQTGDVPRLLPLMEDFNRLEGIPWRPRAMTAALRRLLAEPDLGFVLVGAEGERLVAYAVVTFNYDLEHAGRDAFLTELYVSPAARGHGLGRSLLAACERTGRVRDVLTLHLMVLPENTRALALYQGARYVRSPRVVLSKPLAPSAAG